MLLTPFDFFTSCPDVYMCGICVAPALAKKSEECYTWSKVRIQLMVDKDVSWLADFYGIVTVFLNSCVLKYFLNWSSIWVDFADIGLLFQILGA